MSIKKSDSAPIRLLQLIWDNALGATGHSWRRLNAPLQQGLRLSITSGMKFGRDDFKKIEERYRPQYWMGLGSDSGEGYFTTAAIEDNVSAAVSFEIWKDRKPFHFRGIESDPDISGMKRFEGRRRLFVGSWFHWNGERVFLTSFSKDGESVGACSYAPEKGNPDWSIWTRGKILHRYRITRGDLAAALKKIKEEGNPKVPGKR